MSTERVETIRQAWRRIGGDDVVAHPNAAEWTISRRYETDRDGPGARDKIVRRVSVTRDEVMEVARRGAFPVGTDGLGGALAIAAQRFLEIEKANDEDHGDAMPRSRRRSTFRQQRKSPEKKAQFHRKAERARKLKARRTAKRGED